MTPEFGPPSFSCQTLSKLMEQHNISGEEAGMAPRRLP